VCASPGCELNSAISNSHAGGCRRGGGSSPGGKTVDDVVQFLHCQHLGDFLLSGIFLGCDGASNPGPSTTVLAI
jgi:hypothetical protein